MKTGDLDRNSKGVKLLKSYSAQANYENPVKNNENPFI